MKNIIIHRHAHAYSSHPAVACLGGGELVAVFGRTLRVDPGEGEKSYLHPPGDPGFQNQIVRSLDGGKTWGMPRVLPDYDWYGVECPGITVTREGSVLVNQYRFAWYPLEKGRKLLAEGHRVKARVRGKGWIAPESEADWEAAIHPYVRAHGGTYVQRSRDGGRTWKTMELDVSPYRGGYSNHGGSVREDGTILLALGARAGTWGDAFVVGSSDDGRTWGCPVRAAGDPEIGASEPSLVCLPGGRVLLVTRTKTDRDAGQVFQAVSEDGGLTWGPYEPTPMHGHPSHLLLLSDGRVLCTYGHRRPPYGIRACLSEDGGRSWRIDREMAIRDDMPNRNLGYPTTVEIEPGRLFTIYYGEDGAGVTCIQGTSFTI